MPELIRGHIYDYPKYYDLIFGSDWKPEFDFLEDCFEQFTKRTVERLFEPACGTGRLLIKFANVGYDVVGNDLNPKAVAFCNARFERKGHAPAAVVGDMSDFRLKRKVDAAFNTINSFRHLQTEKAALGHLQCTADALAKGGLYLLGLHLTPADSDRRTNEESWSARRGNLAVVSQMWSEWIDTRKRQEHVGMTFDVYTPTSHRRIIEDTTFRTYSAAQMKRLLAKVPSLEVVEIYDFAYDINTPVRIDKDTEDVVYVLRKR